MKHKSLHKQYQKYLQEHDLFLQSSLEVNKLFHSKFPFAVISKEIFCQACVHILTQHVARGLVVTMSVASCRH